MKSDKLIQEIKKQGWVLNRIRGSHHVFTHPERTGIVVISQPKKELGLALSQQFESRLASRNKSALSHRDRTWQ